MPDPTADITTDHSHDRSGWDFYKIQFPPTEGSSSSPPF